MLESIWIILLTKVLAQPIVWVPFSRVRTVLIGESCSRLIWAEIILCAGVKSV